MVLDSRLKYSLNLMNNITKIYINTDKYKQIKEDTLDLIKSRNIKIYTTNKVKDYKVVIEQNDCFAYKNGKCLALVEMECKGCKFYKNNITQDKIEETIKKYNLSM